MSNLIFRVNRFVKHIKNSRSRFELHSPFVYKIYKDILQDRTFYSEYGKVSKIRSAMLERTDYIKMTDLGALSDDLPWSKKIVKTKVIARKSSVTQHFGHLLFRLARYFKPATILELGTSLGISTAYLAMANQASEVLTIEGCRETAEIAAQNFKHLGLSNIRQVVGNFDDVLPGVLDKSGKIGFVFIDGNHRKKPTLKYFSQILEYLEEDSVIILDDIHWSKEMEEAWKEIQANPSVTISIDLFQMGFVFFSKRLSKEDFILRF